MSERISFQSLFYIIVYDRLCHKSVQPEVNPSISFNDIMNLETIRVRVLFKRDICNGRNKPLCGSFNGAASCAEHFQLLMKSLIK